MPMLTDFMNIAPITYRQTGQISSPQGCGLDDLGSYDRGIQNIGLKLHQHIIRSSSSIHPQFFQFDTGIPDHGIDHIHGLKSDSLQGSPGNMGGCRSTANTRNSSPDILIPIGSGQACQCRYKINPTGIRYTMCQSLHLARRADNP